MITRKNWSKVGEPGKQQKDKEFLCPVRINLYDKKRRTMSLKKERESM